MNREIKFRAWLKGEHNNGNINFGEKGFMDYEPVISGGHYCDVESGWDIQGVYDSVPLMQYTGIKDKNGVEIYEGDIVKRTSTLPGSFDFVGVVEMLEGCWVIHYENGAEKLWTECDINEVIDNIHENPELLEAK